MQRILLTAILTCAVAACSDDESGSGACDPSLSTIKLGMAIGITGPIQIGSMWEAAARMAEHDVNAAGGVNKHCVELVVRDTQSDPAEALRISVDEFLAGGVIDAILFQTSTDTAGLVHPAIGEYFANDRSGPRLPIFCTGCTAPDFDLIPLGDAVTGVPIAEASPLWRMTESNVRQGSAMADLANDRGYTTAGSFVVDNAFGTGYAAAFFTRFTELRQLVDAGYAPTAAWQISHPEVEASPDAGTYLAPLFTSIANTGDPQAILINSYPAGNLAAIGAWAQNGSPGHLLSAFTVYVQELLDATSLGSGLDDIEGVSYAVGAGTKGSQFVTAFSDETGGVQAPVFSDTYYDAVSMFALAAVASGAADPTGDDIQAGMKVINAADGTVVGYGDFAKAVEILSGGGSINYEGVSGSLDHDLGAKNAVDSPLIRWGVANGQLVVTATL